MTSFITVVKNEREVFRSYGYAEHYPTVWNPVEVLGAKAFQGLRCSCGGTADGMSGWVNDLFKMRIRCHKCGLDFLIEKKFKADTLQKDMHILQQKTEQEFLREYTSGKWRTTQKVNERTIERKGKVIEVDFTPDTDNKLLGGIIELKKEDEVPPEAS